MRRLYILFFLSLFLTEAFSQMEYKRFSVDIYGGMPFFYGDVTTKKDGYNVTGRLNYCLTRAVSIGGEFSYGKVSGQNTKYEKYYFTNKYMKAMAGAQIYFFNVLKFHELSKWFQPYVGANVGLVKCDIEDAGSIYAVNEVHFNDWVFGSQWSLGAKFKVSKFMDVNANFSIINMKTDKFDNTVPELYINNYNDVLSTAEIGLTFHMGGKGKEPYIWTTPPCCAANTNNERLDSLEAKVEELTEDVEEAKEDMDSLTNDNLALEERLGSLENEHRQALADLQKSIDDCCKNAANNSGNASGGWGSGDGPDGYIYTAELEGPIEADYYIISGSYAILSNANNRVKVLTDLGYKAVIMKEPKAGLNRVVIDYTDVYNEAIEKVAKYRFELDPKAWIVKQAK